MPKILTILPMTPMPVIMTTALMTMQHIMTILGPSMTPIPAIMIRIIAILIIMMIILYRTTVTTITQITTTL